MLTIYYTYMKANFQAKLIQNRENSMNKKYDKGLRLVAKFIKRVFPTVDSQLERWAAVCAGACGAELSGQALASIKLKRFHAQGGSIYALYPEAHLEKAVKFIVAFQTISDYLDNLCDRAGVRDESSFRQLHLSMQDAVDPSRQLNDYYLYYPFKDDRGYLRQLVEECRRQISGLPSYSVVMKYLTGYVQLYSDLQVLKHLPEETREKRLIDWAGPHLERYGGISTWEFSAAAGSTLGVFVLFSAACSHGLNSKDVKLLDSVYFPWICGLHILLDYFIDNVEDKLHGDLNFTFYYSSADECGRRLSFFAEQCMEQCRILPYADFHSTIIKGLLAMYLSDPKALTEENKKTTRRIMFRGGLDALLYNKLCRLLRFRGKI